MADTPRTPREKVELKPCPFCGTADPQVIPYPNNEPDVWCKNSDCDGHAVSAEAWNRRTALASGSGDHAELARLAEAAQSATSTEEGSRYDEYATLADVVGRERVDFWFRANPDTVLALLAENAALRGERDQIAGESIWWKGVIGDGPYRPSGEVRSIKHLHPAMVKPIYEANKGTAVADVIAGLIFLLAINQNREQFLVADANERRTEAERKLAEAVGLLREARDEIQAHADGATPEWQRRVYASSRSDYAQDMDIPNRIDAFLSKEAERG